MERRDVPCAEAVAGSLAKDRIPEKLQCWLCEKLCVQPVRLACCDCQVCGKCSISSSTWSECPLCEYSPFAENLCTPSPSLRTTIKVFTKYVWRHSQTDKEDYPSDAASCKKACRASKVDLSFATSSCRLLRLPQELLDIIFDLAYPQEVGGRYVTVSEWRKRRFSQQHLSGQVPITLPQTKAMGLAVSKQFFLNAGAAWLKNNVFVSGKLALRVVHHLPGQRCALAYDFAPGLSLKQYPLETFFCGILHRELRGVTIKVAPSMVCHPDSKNIPDLLQLEEAARGQGLYYLSTLAKIQLDPEFDYQPSQKDQEEWMVAVKKLESLLEDPRYALAEMLEKLSIAN
ncbi:hypothetical protein HII31_03686 [Pseudocercospora fuligena]|uniref:Uncharacterized protein n=1 Tax=Pseudocercospora fuligena TaxID=685502 RepID=A0A8H6VLT1_9PEZI|nr:hypothetical protein HII31_03686 [Pseudocercospora fuligena]